MNSEQARTLDNAMQEAVAQLREAAQARKCWSCGCLHEALKAIDRALPEPRQPGDLKDVIRSARSRLAEVRYDCLG